MAYYFLVLLLVVSASASPSRRTKLDQNDTWKVVGGTEAEKGAYPWQISLERDNSQICGGSIVHQEWVVTAAHCVVRTSASEMSIVAGVHSLEEGGDKYKVLEIHYHSKYDPYNKHNDVAILKVEPIAFNEKVQPILAETEYVGGDVPCTLTGWGRTSYPGGFPDTLQSVEMKSVTFDYCRKQHGWIILDSEICTFTKYGEGACHGDSGGPLVTYQEGIPKLVGIVSWGRPCAVGLPDVFARVSAYIDWFNSKCDNCLLR